MSRNSLSELKLFINIHILSYRVNLKQINKLKKKEIRIDILVIIFLLFSHYFIFSNEMNIDFLFLFFFIYSGLFNLIL